MNQLSSTSEQWIDLYETAAAFKKAECWSYFTNGHIFGVENPLNGEIGYCCIMGNGGELYGLAVYLGTEGLEALIGMMSGELKIDPMFSHHCLMLSFDSRDELYPAERKQIKELGLKFRGAYAWPTFRLYEPGFLPWPIQNGGDVQFLRLVLQQAMEVVQAFKFDPDAIMDGEANAFLTRVSNRDLQHLVWSDQWIVPKPLVKANVLTPNPIDELRLVKIKRSLKGYVGIWEIDCSYAPMPINEGDRPYYPMMGLIVDQESEQILRFGLSEKSGAPDKMVELFLEIIEQAQVIPKEIWFCSEELLHYLRQILNSFEIQAYLTSELPALQEAKEAMMDHFSGGR